MALLFIGASGSVLSMMQPFFFLNCSKTETDNGCGNAFLRRSAIIEGLATTCD